MADRNILRCPRCDAEVVSVPEGREPEGAIFCSNCGAEVRPPDIVDKAVDAAEKAAKRAGEAVKEAADRLKKPKI